MEGSVFVNPLYFLDHLWPVNLIIFKIFVSLQKFLRRSFQYFHIFLEFVPIMRCKFPYLKCIFFYRKIIETESY